MTPAARRWPLLLVFLLAGSLSATACHRPVTIVTPAGKAAYTADQVVLRVNELQAAVIQAEATGGLPTATTRQIVQFCVAADKTLAASPTGWQATVSAAWAGTKARLPVITNPAVQAAITAIDVLLATQGT